MLNKLLGFVFLLVSQVAGFRTELNYANEFELIRPQNIRLNYNCDNYNIFDINPVLINSGDVVTVSFHSSTPRANDWIGAYSPIIDFDDLKETVPVKYGWASIDPLYLETGYGNLEFNMTNLREDIGFYYFTNGLSFPIFVGQARKTVKFINPNQPLRPRIVATGDYDILQLVWSSATSTDPILKWGINPGVYDHIINATTLTIDPNDLCGEPATTIGWRDLGLIHNAYFNGMIKLAEQKIYYIFGDQSTNDFSSEFILNVPPLDNTQRPTTVILYDDLGRGTLDDTYTWNEYGRPAIKTAMSVGAKVQSGLIDAVYHGGDISYARGYMAVWDFFGDMLTPITSGTLYLTTVGNHESDWPNSASYFNGTDSGGECGVLTTTLYPMPQPATVDQPWWSYNVGLIHFIGMSTEHDFTIGSKQYLWLENDLMNVDRQKTPWILFGGHRAMYINSNYSGSVSSDESVMNLMIDNLEPLLYKYKVNIGFYGHNHVVQRQSAVYNRTVVQHPEKQILDDGSILWVHNNPQATVHMVVGTGGASFTFNSIPDKPSWNELYFYKWGYAQVTAINSTHLDWKWIDNEDDSVIDHMLLIQN